MLGGCALCIQNKKDFEQECDILISPQGKLTDLLPFSCIQNGFIKLNEFFYLTEIASIIEEIKCYIILGRLRFDSEDYECSLKLLLNQEQTNKQQQKQFVVAL